MSESPEQQQERLANLIKSGGWQVDPANFLHVPPVILDPENGAVRVNPGVNWDGVFLSRPYVFQGEVDSGVARSLHQQYGVTFVTGDDQHAHMRVSIADFRAKILPNIPQFLRSTPPGSGQAR